MPTHSEGPALAEIEAVAQITDEMVDAAYLSLSQAGWPMTKGDRPALATALLLAFRAVSSRASAVVDALEESNSLLAAMLHEDRPHEEIEKQIRENRDALNAVEVVSAPKSKLRMVPVEPTKAMLTAAWDNSNLAGDPDDYVSVWTAMINAAPLHAPAETERRSPSVTVIRSAGGEAAKTVAASRASNWSGSATSPDPLLPAGAPDRREAEGQGSERTGG